MRFRYRNLNQMIVAVVIFASAVMAQAYGKQTTVTGTVLDEASKPMKGVTVVVSTDPLPEPITAETNASGEFLMVLPNTSWNYQFRFNVDGYQEVLVPLASAQVADAVIELQMVPEPADHGPVEPAPAAASPPQSAEQRNAAIPFFNQGLEAWDAGDVAAAALKFQEALTIDPSFAEAHRALAGLAVEAEDWGAAAKHADAMLELMPGDVPAMRTVYFGSLMVGDVDRAAAVARDILKATPDAAEEILANAGYFFENNQNQEARALAEVVVEAQPESADAQVMLALSCNALGDTAAAIPAFEKFLELAPEDHGDLPTAKAILEYIK